jgi:flagellin-like hook-associated protein FlgL
MSDGLSAAVRTNLLALQKLASDIGRVQMRLASGKRVNSPSENPAAFFTASALNARAAALNSIVDGIGTGKKVLEAASAGIESMQSMISSARSVALEALNSASTLATVTGSVTGLTGETALINYENGDSITVDDGTTTATYTYTNGETVQHFLDALNNTANLKVDATLSADGRIVLAATGVNSVVIGGSASIAEKADIGLASGTTTSTSNALRTALAQEFDSIRSQISAIAIDSGFNGQNLLGGSAVTITLNETGSSQVIVAGSTVTASSLGIDAATTTGGNLQYDGDINTFLADLDAAEASLQQMASSYSAKLTTVSVREDFSKSMASLLETGAGNLVNADMDLEGAMLLALQARRELAATSLSLAADADTTALRLFGVG